MTANNTDSLKESIAELVGKKPAELKPENGPNVVRTWQTYLAEQGYTVTNYYHNEKPAGRHIILYGAADGSIQAMLSDSEAAGTVKPLSRMTVTKATKASQSKET